MSGRSLVPVVLLALCVVAPPAHATYPGTNGLIVLERAVGDQPPANLHVINPDGSGDRLVFATPNQEGEGTFSPAGTQMAFTRGPFRRGDFTGPPQIYVGDLNLGQPRRLTNFRAGAIAPSFSPDGTKIVFFGATRNGPKNAPPPLQIYSMNADGTGVRQLTRGSLRSFDPDWSPDGTKIVFSDSKQVRKNVFANRIALMNADGTGRRALTSFSGPDEINPKWSPDGTRIFFERVRFARGRPSDSDIMAMNPDGTGVAAILATAAFETNPIPSPDGTKIAFTSDRDRRGKDRLGPGFELYTMNVDATGITRLTTNRSTDAFPDWQRLP